MSCSANPEPASCQANKLAKLNIPAKLNCRRNVALAVSDEKEFVMRTIDENELDFVSGGLCENMSISQCFSGSVETIVHEVNSLFSALNTWGGDLGIWVYNTTHC